MRLAGKTALITGGGQGIGRACALRFAAEGATVVIIDQAADKATGVIAELEGTHHAIAADVTKEIEVQEAVKKAVAFVGGIDVLVHCAGISLSVRSILETPLVDWQRLLDVNLTGTFLVCREVARVMAPQKRGSIINLASSAGTLAQQGGTPYGTSKAGVAHLTRIIAMDMAPYGVRVNAIAPGPVETPLLNSHAPERQARYVKRIPAGRRAQPEEVANVALFLASDESSFMTGAVVAADGGFTVAGLREVA